MASLFSVIAFMKIFQSIVISVCCQYKFPKFVTDQLWIEIMYQHYIRSS